MEMVYDGGKEKKGGGGGNYKNIQTSFQWMLAPYFWDSNDLNTIAVGFKTSNLVFQRIHQPKTNSIHVSLQMPYDLK